VRNLLHGIALALCLATVGQAAERYSEGFAGGSAAPASSLTLGVGSWSFTGGIANAKFASSLPMAIPDIASLRPSNAAFTGDYISAGIGVLGFKFRSALALPSCVFVELRGPSAVFQRAVPVAGVGTWSGYMVSLSSAEAGGWTAVEGRAADFEETLRDVKSVEIKIQRSGATAREYAIDDLYVDGLPQATGGVAADGGHVTVAWDAMQAGSPYTMQQSASLSGPWEDVHTVAATSRLQAFSIPAGGSDSQAFFRLRGP
jgi:hypothetical protein